MFAPDHATHTESTAHRNSKVQYLLVADETSLAPLEAALALLPLCARGRVFIEVPTGAEVSRVSVPPRMTVTWLSRSGRAGAPGTCTECAPGVAVLRAVRAWAAEMFCNGPDETVFWLAGRFDAVSDLYEDFTGIGFGPDAITTPEAFRLGTRPVS
ncbi:MAG: SIP domain-containing protein [Microbacteriaceae bacterium]